jgi:hypothetical protein
MSRPPSRTGLNTTTQRELVWHLAKGLGTEEAAKRAGLPSSARLYQFKRTKEFAAELREALNDHLSTEIAPRAFHLMDEIMRDTKANPRVRLDAAKALVDRAGYAPRPSGSDNPGEKDMASMTRAELERFIREADIRRAKVKMIEGEVIDVTDVGGAPGPEPDEPDQSAAEKDPASIMDDMLE